MKAFFLFPGKGGINNVVENAMGEGKFLLRRRGQTLEEFHGAKGFKVSRQPLLHDVEHFDHIQREFEADDRLMIIGPVDRIRSLAKETV